MNLILAAGSQQRWNATHEDLPAIKQLIEIKGEILIERIQRQFTPVQVITHLKEIQQHSKSWFVPRFNNVTIETLLSTQELWTDQHTTILLGDVYYGRQTVKKIKEYSGKLQFWGDKNEIYAFKFHKTMNRIIEMNIRKLLHHVYYTEKFGKLWNLYRMLHHIDFRTLDISDNITFVYDSMDFDTKQEYLYYMKMKF